MKKEQTETLAAPSRLKRTGEVFLIPFNQIEIDSEMNNGRIDLGDLEELADSIQESGLRIPLLVKKVRNEERYLLVHGKRRLKALEILINRGVEMPGIKCTLTVAGYSIENSLFDQIIMNDGKPYSSVEQGIVFSQLVDRGYDVKEISKKVAKSVTHILNCIEIASLPKKIRDLVATGAVSGLTAVQLSKVVTSEDELIDQLQTAVEKAPLSPDGEKKKVTNKNVEQIASISPLKKMSEVKRILLEREIENERTELFMTLLSRLKAGVDIEELIQLFE